MVVWHWAGFGGGGGGLVGRGSGMVRCGWGRLGWRRGLRGGVGGGMVGKNIYCLGSPDREPCSVGLVSEILRENKLSGMFLGGGYG